MIPLPKPNAHTASLGDASRLYAAAASAPLSAAARALSEHAIVAAGDAGKPLASAYTRIAAISADLASREAEAREAAVAVVRSTFKSAGIEASAAQIQQAAEPRVRETMLAHRKTALVEVQTLRASIAAATPAAPASAGVPAEAPHEGLALQQFIALQGGARAAAIAKVIGGADDGLAAALVRNPERAGLHAGTAQAIRHARFAATNVQAVAPALLGLAQLTADTVISVENQLTAATLED